MADQTRANGAVGLVEKFVDMGDGTFARVVAMQLIGAEAGAVTLNIDEADLVAIGLPADTAWSGTGDGTLIAIAKALFAKFPAALGAAAGAASLSVVPATDATFKTGARPGVLTDRSAALTAGATAQDLMGANAARTRLVIGNPHATEDLWVAFFGATAAANGLGSLRIAAGATLILSNGDAPVSAVSAIATTTGHKITAWEG